MDKDLILNARKACVEEYLKGKGEILLKEGRQYRVERYAGLVVSGNKWYSFGTFAIDVYMNSS